MGLICVQSTKHFQFLKEVQPTFFTQDAAIDADISLRT